uniref:Uncharacterized protein AlNc14C31G2850 n=1 Tax=Albugo laibachii Nc14 TaxID=890382 RepID=F0W7P6_9STRA|nr:conserved hypothetical protein [Albugo laibachii Nc14]|eukprot:CCA17147.1 conserved hypothetical protein [Albugo laibachii Nc14]
MKSTFFTSCSTGCAFFSLVYPAWFQQRYKADDVHIVQGFGLFAFHSSGVLRQPFYASDTMLQYDAFCDMAVTPNYMLNDGEAFHSVLCGKRLKAIQSTTAAAAALSVVVLVFSIASVYKTKPGLVESTIGCFTFVASILLSVSLTLWGWLLQQRLYRIDTINVAYATCKVDDRQWSCWFYGCSFWACLAAIILLSLTGYFNSAASVEKMRFLISTNAADVRVLKELQSAQDTHHQPISMRIER